MKAPVKDQVEVIALPEIDSFNGRKIDETKLPFGANEGEQGMVSTVIMAAHHAMARECSIQVSLR